MGNLRQRIGQLRRMGANAAMTMADLRMDRKLIVIFIFLIILPITVTGMISYTSYSRSIERNTVSYVTEMSDKMLTKLDDSVDDMKRLSAIPLYSFELQNSIQLRKYLSTPDQGLQKQRDMDYYITVLNNLVRGTNSVYMPAERLGGVVSTSLMRFSGFNSAQWNLICAALVITLIPTVILYLFLQRFIFSGVTSGAVKS